MIKNKIRGNEQKGHDMNEPTEIISPNKKDNVFITRIKKYQIITITMAFLLLYRTFDHLIYYFKEGNSPYQAIGLNIWLVLSLHIVVYILQWLILTWIASKYTAQSLKEKIYGHPIITLILLVIYLHELPYRYANSSLGSNLVGIFELTIYYAFLFYIYWLIICWLSKLIWKRQRYQWIWYNKLVDKLIVIIPIIYKFLLGIIISIVVFINLFTILTRITNYSGVDIWKLFHFN